jgi:rod shape-determining protein MreD
MKLRAFWIFIIACAALFLQVFLLNGPDLLGLSPDISLFLVFLLSFYSYTPHNRREYTITTTNIMVANWLIGLTKDIISHSGFGTMAFLYLLSGLLVSLARQLIFKNDIIIQIIFLFAITWFCHFLHGIGLSVLYGNLAFWYVVAKSLLIALYTSLIGGLILVVIHKIYWWHQTKITAP